MMFEKFGIHKNVENENMNLIPVSSFEEVAMHFRNEDETNRYEYFLLQIKHPHAQKATPPPFTKAVNKAFAKKENTLPFFAAVAAEPVVNEPVMDEPIVTVTPAPVETAAPAVSAPAAPVASPVAKMEKDDIPYLIENADLLLQSGELELARNIYRAVLRSGDSSDLAYAGLAICADKEGLVEQAIQFAWDSVAFAPNRKGYQILAQLLVQQGRDQEAAQALNRAIKALELTVQEKADYYKMIGNCMSRLGQTTEAERSYKKALELSPASDEVQSNLGSLYLEQGQVSDAKRCYQDSIASNSNNDKGWVGLGLCCVAEGDKESAHEAFARSLEKNLRNSTAIFHLVKCAYEIKKYSTAEKMLSTYVEIAPVSPSLLYSLAGLQFHVGKKREASQTAKRILHLKADHQGARELIRKIEAE